MPRASQRSIPVEIQARDLVLLKLIYELPYVDAAQLSRLLPVSTLNPQLRGYHDQRRQERAVVASGGDHARVRREVLRRLQQLLHAKGGPYIQRHKVNNNSPRLYTIAPRAVDLLAAEYDLDAAALARSARNRDPGEKFLRHTRLRTGFRFAMIVATMEQPDIRIVYWHKDGSIKIPISYQCGNGTMVEDNVIPDEFIGLGHGGTVEPFPVEADKRRDFPRVKAKFQAYVHLWRQIRQGNAQLPRAPQHLVRDLRRSGQLRSDKPVYLIVGKPVVDFRVLWVAQGVERKEGLRRLAREVGGPQAEAAGLFWFTHESQYIDQPERVLGPIWQKARNDLWRPLLNDTTP
jgi:Replication-relaxation